LDAASVDPLLEKLGALRSQLKKSTETVDGIRERTANAAEGEELEDRVNHVVQLALRLVATLGEMDVRLGESAERLADTQTKGRSLQATTRSYIVTAEVGAFLLIAWMAAGQVSLCRHGWKDARQRQSAA
jgi:chromosome segregation ATPase